MVTSILSFSHNVFWVLHGSVVKCLTRNLGPWIGAKLDPLGFL